MTTPELTLLVVVALAGSTVAAVVGFGGGVILLPVLVAVRGVREAVPVLAITQVVGNLSRGVLNRREIDLPVVGWFSLGAVPCGVLGGLLFATAPLPMLTKG